jgi:hypothetical protein
MRSGVWLRGPTTRPLPCISGVAVPDSAPFLGVEGLVGGLIGVCLPELGVVLKPSSEARRAFQSFISGDSGDERM